MTDLRIGVLGAGSWGTALAIHLARAGRGQVTLWARSPEVAEALARDRVNETYLPGVRLADGIEVTADLRGVTPCDLVLVVVPSHGFRAVLRDFLAVRKGNRPATIVSGTKGVETDTLARMSQVCFEEGTAARQEIRFAVVSGPCFAVELAAGMPTASVVASEDGSLATELQDLFSVRNLRLYTSQDVVGVELGGTVKNVIAIAAGAATGLGFGHNTLAALITRGLHELTRLGLACGGQARTFSGLAGLGDLVLTCTGGPSRNRRTGLELAKGKSLEEITAKTTMVAEGVRNSKAIAALAAQRDVEMPITEQMVAVLYHAKSPQRAVEDLMSRELKTEAQL